MISRQLQALKSMVGAKLSHRVQYLILHVNSVCNARCRMCFNWDHMATAKSSKGHSLEQLKQLAKSMGALPQLTLSGGEPLLREDIAEILAIFYTQAGTRFFSVPTNALRPERVQALIERFTQACPQGFLNFCLPFHGVEGKLDDIIGVPGSYHRLCATYEIIRKARRKSENISCVLNCVMSKFNYRDYEQVIDHAWSSFPDAPFGFAYARGETHEREAIDVPVEAYEKAYASLVVKRCNRSRSNPYTIVFDNIGRQIADVVSGVARGTVRDLHCGAGHDLLVIYENGAVYPCELFELMSFPREKDPPAVRCLGNLQDFDYDLGALLASGQARGVLSWIERHECACTWECAIYSKILHSPKDMAWLSFRSLKYLFARGFERGGTITGQSA